MPRCKICKCKFVPRWAMQPTCLENDGACAVEYAKQYNEKKRQKAEHKRKQDWAKEKKVLTEKSMKFSQWLNLLQKEVNTFIRLRDKDKVCISCAGWLGKKYHAGHFYSVGSHPNLRFDEDNIHGQCEQCNIHFRGNQLEYRFHLPARIGMDKFEALEARKEVELKISVPDIKLKIQYYRAEIKKIKNL